MPTGYKIVINKPHEWLITLTYIYILKKKFYIFKLAELLICQLTNRPGSLRSLHNRFRLILLCESETLYQTLHYAMLSISVAFGKGSAIQD